MRLLVFDWLTGKINSRNLLSIDFSKQLRTYRELSTGFCSSAVSETRIIWLNHSRHVFRFLMRSSVLPSQFILVLLLVSTVWLMWFHKCRYSVISAPLTVVRLSEVFRCSDFQNSSLIAGDIWLGILMVNFTRKHKRCVLTISYQKPFYVICLFPSSLIFH